MLAYVARRVLTTVPVVLVVAVVVFGLLYLTPGDPALVIAGDQATPRELAHIRAALGLDRSPFIRFGLWLWQMLHGDLGQSIFTGQPVAHLIAQRLGPTLSLLGLSVLISVGVGVPLGVLAAWRQGRAPDRALTALNVLGYALPVFVAGYVLAYVFAVRLRWAPVEGFAPVSQGVVAFLRSLALPAVTLSIVYANLIAAVTRSSMLEVLSQDYIRTAAAKGVPQRDILFRHALKNASVPIATIIGSGVATLIGGAVIVEDVFAVPGLGRLTVDAVLHRDYPVIQGVVLLSSVSYVLINLAVDVFYTVLDPRIRY